MTTAAWVALLAVAALWPSRLAGPLNGAPLDAPLEAVIIGLVLPALIAFDRRVLRQPVIRLLIVTLLAFKALTAATLAQDGWCLRFTSPAPLFLDQERVPHAWDIRADWRAATPQCSAVMDRGYASILAFPVWFYNLPPNNLLEPARADERPPSVTAVLDLSGHLFSRAAGVFRIAAGPDVTLTADIDGAVYSQADLDRGITLPEGSHHVAVRGQLAGERWALVPQWDGRELWTSAVATMTPARFVDRLARPWARWLSLAWLVAIVGWSAAHVARGVGARAAAVSAAAAAVTAASGLLGGGAALRLAPIAWLLPAWVRMPRRAQNLRGAVVLIGVPFLVLIAIRGAGEAGLVTWYTSGDDWWMFQRFAYRIFMEGYWLEAGEPTFWFQPLYRWIAGGLHIIFGDSSVGELFWDAGCTLTGGLFAFHVTRTIAGFRWGIAAATLTLLLMTAGPAWYLFGRGLSELTSAGFIYAGALFALRARTGSWRFIALAGICVVLAFYSRLNNLPMAIAIAAFALPVRYPIGRWTRVTAWWPRASWRLVGGVVAALGLGLVAFTWRTYYYTGEWSLLHGTQASARSVWQPTGDGESTLQNVAGSVLMVLTMSDPARFDLRALPLILGTLAAVAGLAGAPVFRQLPLNAVMLCLAGFVGSFVARGSAYPGRFSVHLVPAAVTLAMCTIALVAARRSSREV